MSWNITASCVHSQGYKNINNSGVWEIIFFVLTVNVPKNNIYFLSRSDNILIKIRDDWFVL